MKSRVLTASAVVVLMLAACSSSTSTSPSGGSDAGTSPDGSTGTGDAAGDSSSNNSDGGTDGSQQGACTNATVPAAGSNCTIEGNYSVVEDVTCPNSCNATPASPFQVAVTVSAGTVTFQGTGAIRHLNCTLNGCECDTSHGHRYVFTSTGFVGQGDGIDANNCRYGTLDTGTRQ